MHKIKTDPIKNILYIHFGKSDRTVMKAYANQIEQACKKLIPGFSCIEVFSKNDSIKQKDNDMLFSTEDLILAYGASHIVRVGRFGESLVQFQSIWMNMQGNIKVENAATLQEAETILNMPKYGR